MKCLALFTKNSQAVCQAIYEEKGFLCGFIFLFFYLTTLLKCCRVFKSRVSSKNVMKLFNKRWYLEK